MKTHGKNGKPTAYGFACGYTQTVKVGTVSLTLSMQHHVYRLNGFLNGKWIAPAARTRKEMAEVIKILKTPA